MFPCLEVKFAYPLFGQTLDLCINTSSPPFILTNFQWRNSFIWGWKLLWILTYKITIILAYKVAFEMEITVNFGSPKVHLSHSQCLKSSTSDHVRTTLLFSTSYFFAHYFWICVIIILVPTLERTKRTHSELEL